MANVQRLGGGAFGFGGTAAARQFFDEPGQKRYLQPSVLFGLGSGTVASGLYLADIDTPLQDGFWAAHAITAIPTGLFSLVFPKASDVTTLQQVKQAFGFGGTSGSGGSDETETQATAGTATVSTGRTRRR